MDVISLSKAKKAKKSIRALNDRLGEGVEDVYTNVKTRLEELEKKDPHVTLYNRVSDIEANTAVNLNKHNLHVNTVLNKSKFGLTDLAFDDFGDASGIDAAKSTGHTFDATDKLFKIASGQTQANLVTTAESLPAAPQMITVSQAFNEQNTASDAVDLTQGTLTNVEVKNGKLQLTSPNGGTTFSKTGTYESPILDCGDNFKSLNKVENVLVVPSGTSANLFTATSSDSIAFSEYLPLNTDGTIASPSGRYVKVKAELTGGYEVKETVVHDFLASESSDFQANDYVVLDGSAKLKIDFSYTMNPDASFTEIGTLLRKNIDKTSFKTIEKVSVI